MAAEKISIGKTQGQKRKKNVDACPAFCGLNSPLKCGKIVSEHGKV